MRFWKTPGGLRRIATLLLFALPLLVLTSLLARKMAWWQWDFRGEWPVWAGVFAGLSLLAIFLMRVNRGALVFVTAIGCAHVLYCLDRSIRQENVVLGLFSVVLGILWLAYIDRLWTAFRFPAIYPGMRWYQSKPEPIPGVHLDWGEQKGLKLSQLDLEGGFVLGHFSKGSEKTLPSEIILHYRGARISCGVSLISGLNSEIDSSWAGIGVEFKNTNSDSRKDLADFIEVLRGEGHVDS